MGTYERYCPPGQYQLRVAKSLTIIAISPVAPINGVFTTLALTSANLLMYPTVALGYHLLEDVPWPSSTTLTAMIPPGLVPGTHEVRVIQPNMQSGVWTGEFNMWGTAYLPIVVRKWS
jgi:hypothetical protein